MMNRIHAGTHIVAMKPKPIVWRRRKLQAYYGSAALCGSRLPFLLEPPAAAKALASMVFIAGICRCAGFKSMNRCLACYLPGSAFA
jgi:hypothetical protein